MAAVFAASAYHPTVVFDWFLENLIMLVFIIALILTYRGEWIKWSWREFENIDFVPVEPP